MTPYGWLNNIYDIALDGVFKIDGYNQIESVERRPLYSVFAYMSWKTAKSNYESEYQRIAINEAKNRR